MTHPSVSIPIISYNQADFIQETVISAVEQDYDNLEVIICDDASTDSTQAILLEIASQYPNRVNLHFNETNLGGGRNRLKSLSLCHGEFITYLDGDDLFLSGKIQKQVAFMLDRPDCTLSYHNVEVFDSKTEEKIFNWKDRFGSGDGDIKRLVRYGNYLCTLSVMFRRDDLPKLKFYENIPVGLDWIVIFQILMKGNGKYCYLDEVLARYRRHATNMTLNWEGKVTSQLTTLNLIQEQAPKFAPEIRMRRAEIFLLQTLIHVQRKNLSMASKSLFKSLKYAFPLWWKLLRLPSRELLFWMSSGRKMDDLMKSLINR